ncbi:MAG: RnfABCDGE type electron transport complex subunit D [Treponema sp.]|jgi:electron transport complex protein RnfD|nr:RnfABCDGE type electron transport complex subunit D [Treponema sp.]
MAAETWKQEKRINLSPQVNFARSTTSRMVLVACCALMAIIQSAISDGGASLFVAFSALAGAVLTELLVTWRRDGYRTLLDGSAVVSALVLTLLLPNRINLFCAFFAAVFAMAVIKHSFGGLGSNWVNPALGGWLFMRISFPQAFEKALEGSSLSILFRSLASGFSNPQGSPLAILKISGTWQYSAGSSLDQTFRNFLNSTIFAIPGAELPAGYIDLFNSRSPGIIADRGILGLLVGSILICASQVNRAWISALFLLVYGFLVRTFGALPFGGAAGQGDVLFSFLSGGTLVAAFLLITDPATGAKSNTGIIVLTVLGAIFTFIFREQGREMYGAFFATALINALLPLFRYTERCFLFNLGKRRG